MMNQETAICSMSEAVHTFTTQVVVMPPAPAWWDFVYNDKPRLAFIFKYSPERGGFQTMTPDGFRTFKPSRMKGIQDVTWIGDGGNHQANAAYNFMLALNQTKEYQGVLKLC